MLPKGGVDRPARSSQDATRPTESEGNPLAKRLTKLINGLFLALGLGMLVVMFVKMDLNEVTDHLSKTKWHFIFAFLSLCNRCIRQHNSLVVYHRSHCFTGKVPPFPGCLMGRTCTQYSDTYLELGRGIQR